MQETEFIWGNVSSYAYEVEKFVLCDSSLQQTRVLRISIVLWDDGRESQAIANERDRWPFDYDGDPGLCNWRWFRSPMHEGKGGTLEVWGTALGRVRKVYGEKRAMFKIDKSLSSQTGLEGNCHRTAKKTEK